MMAFNVTSTVHLRRGSSGRLLRHREGEDICGPPCFRRLIPIETP